MWMEVILVDFNLALGWLIRQTAKISSHKQYIAIMYRTVEEIHTILSTYSVSHVRCKTVTLLLINVQLFGGSS